jgi:hypothetical protein
MEIQLPNKLLYKSIDNKKEYYEYVLKLISESKIDKVIYQGLQNEINYKMIKHILISKSEKMSNAKSKYIPDPDEIRKRYFNLIQPAINDKYCIIIKN